TISFMDRGSGLGSGYGERPGSQRSARNTWIAGVAALKSATAHAICPGGGLAFGGATITWPYSMAGCTGQGRGSAARMTELDDIYSTRSLELSADIPLAERLADPDGTATAHSKLCGSTVTVDLKLAGDRVAAFGQTVKACLLGQASASVM